MASLVTWPEEIGPRFAHEGTHLTVTARFKLITSQGDAYALYFRKLEFGFGRAIEIQTYISRQDPRKRLVGVRWLSGNAFGLTPEGKPRSLASPATMNWQATRTAFFPTRRLAVGYIEGQVVRLNKKSTKPIRPLTVEQVKEWMKAGPHSAIPVPGTRRKYGFKPQP